MCKATNSMYRRSYSTVVPNVDTSAVMALKEARPTKKPEVKRVTFNRDVVAQPYIHLNNMTEEEVANTWLSHEELADIRAECCHAVKLMNAGKIQQADSLFCCRGLEYRTSSGSRLRKEHKYAAWDAVEEEQNRQWHEGLFDAEQLAEVYLMCSDESEKMAHYLALRDAQDVEQLDESDMQDICKQVSLACSTHRSFCSPVIHNPSRRLPVLGAN